MIRKADGDCLWDSHCSSLTPKYLSANLSNEKAIREEMTPLPIPPSADAYRVLLVAAVCRRWRGLTQRCVSALLVRDNLVVSRQALASAVAALPNLTHLHLCDGSVETLDDSFLAHLASSCPNLAILHVGSRIAPVKCKDFYAGKCEKDAQPITTAGLDFFFRHCTRLEQLSLYCLDRCVEFPASFFQLPYLHTLALTNASPLETPDFASLSSLTTLHIASNHLLERVANIVRLSRITAFSHSEEAVAFHRDSLGLADFNTTQLALLKSSKHEDFASYDLPDDIGCLLALKTLVLHRLPLLSLPGALCHLPSLETIVLIECTTYPHFKLYEDFCCLTSLQTLAIVKMPWTRLPENIGELSRLHTLYLNGQNQQPRLPLSFTQLTSLTRLELAMCTIQELPEDLGNLTNLQELHIRSCPRIQRLPESLTSISSLETLTVDDCLKLVSVPGRLDSLGRLKWLELTGCPDHTEPPTCLPLSLEVLSLGNSYHVADLPDVSMLPSLRKLCLKLVGGEERMAVSSSLARVKQVELALQEEAVELPFSLALLPQLHTLVMWNAGKMQRLPSDMGWAVPQLRVLQIHCARELRELPDSIGAASRLRQLYLFDCPSLYHLPASLTQLACLHQLHVEKTGLRCLPLGIAWLGCFVGG
ncbi:unnamed protein product [Closterium sp. NIES-54]